jgi:hypothetical protein
LGACAHGARQSVAWASLCAESLEQETKSLPQAEYAQAFSTLLDESTPVLHRFGTGRVSPHCPIQFSAAMASQPRKGVTRSARGVGQQSRLAVGIPQVRLS